MRLLGLVLVLAMATSLAGCGGSPSGSSTTSSAPPTTTVPCVSCFYGTYNAIFEKVLDTGCDIALAEQALSRCPAIPTGRT